MEKKNMIKLAMGVIAVLICGILYLYGNRGRGTVPSSDSWESVGQTGQQTDSSGVAAQATPKETSRQDETVYIDVTGQVKKPGVYSFDHEPRVVEVIKKAGGFTKKADTAAVNQAVPVADGTQLIIPVKGKKTGQDTTASAPLQGNADPKININTASKEELMTLTGIGEAKATEIISYRESHGGYHAIEDIKNISGIKDGVFNKIKDLITV